MSTLTTNYLDIIERLPAGAKLELPDIEWDEYEHLLTQMESQHPGHRLRYDCGRLIIVSPKREHEFFKLLFGRLAQVLAEESGVNVEATGATTLRRKRLGKGVEPDESYYVQHAANVIGRLEFDLGVDPPPDVAIEIDMTNDSLDKFTIYAALGVPEIWRYDGEAMRFYKLAGENYELIQNSLTFPVLTAEDLTQCLEQSKAEGQTAAAKAFRQMLHSRSSS
jgi:Uma2 family endonuclease